MTQDDKRSFSTSAHFGTAYYAIDIFTRSLHVMKRCNIVLCEHVHVIIESVDSISRDQRDSP